MGYYDMYNYDGTRKPSVTPQQKVLSALATPPPQAQGPDLSQLYAAAGQGSGQGSASSLQTTSNQLLSQMLQDPSKLESMPGYQYLMDSGRQALERSLAGRGHLNSGNRDIELTKLGQGLAGQQYQSMANMLSGIGQTAASQGSNTFANMLNTAKFGWGAQQDAQNRLDKQYQNAMQQATIYDPSGYSGDRQYTQQQFKNQWGV